MIVEGPLKWSDLVTFLEGEPAWDPSRGVLIALPCDMVKIRGVGDSHLCVFYDSLNKGCSIYENRPVECRELKCWDTEAIEKMFLMDMLSREDICQGNSDILSLMVEHSSRYGVAALFSLLQKGEMNSYSEIGSFCRDEGLFRESCIKDFNLDSKILDFVFGRPATVVQEGLKAAMGYGR